MKSTFFPSVVFFIVLAGSGQTVWALAKKPPVVVQVPQAEVSILEVQIPALGLTDLIQEALAHNPELHAYEERWKASKARVWEAISWDDTMVGADFEGIPGGRVDADRAKNIEWMVSQRIPFPGKKFLKGRVASKEAKMAEADYRAKEREIISEVKKAYSEYFLRERETWNHEETQQILERMSKSAEAKYATRKISYQEVLKAHTELALILNDIAKHHQQRETALARLNMLLGREAWEPLHIGMSAPEANLPYTRDELMKLALEHRPELRAVRYGFEAARTDAKSAWLDLLPDGQFRIEARHFSGGSGIKEYDQFFGFEVPVVSLIGRVGQIREKQAEKKAAESALENMKNMVLYEVQKAWAEFESNDRSVKMFESNVIPQAESIIQSSLAQYESGQGDFLAVMEVQRALTEFRHEYFHSLAMREESFAELEKVVGVDLGGGVSK